MMGKIAHVNKAVYGSVGAFLAMLIIQVAVGWLNSQNVDVTPDQQAQLAGIVESFITSLIGGVLTYGAIYASPANKPRD